MPKLGVSCTMAVVRGRLGTVLNHLVLTSLLVSLLTFSLLRPVSLGDYAAAVPVPGETGGPDFVDLGNWFVDTTLITEPIELHPTLTLFVTIWDEATVDLVVGSYKKGNESLWTNVTMTFMGYSQLDPQLHYFEANATKFTLSPSHPLEVWNIKYYAHDSLGRWNMSGVINGSINALYDLDTTETTTATTTTSTMSVTTPTTPATTSTTVSATGQWEFDAQSAMVIGMGGLLLTLVALVVVLCRRGGSAQT